MSRAARTAARGPPVLRPAYGVTGVRERTRQKRLSRATTAPGAGPPPGRAHRRSHRVHPPLAGHLPAGAPGIDALDDPARAASRGPFHDQLEELLGEECGTLVYPDPGPPGPRRPESA